MQTSIDRQDSLSVADFSRLYRDRRRPVILTCATAKWTARQWTPQSLRTQLGARPVTMRTMKGSETLPFDRLSELIEHSTPDAPAPYARNIDIARDLPEIWPDVQPRLPYACPDWKSSGLLPRDFIFPNGLAELFYGGQGACFPRLHIDYWGMDGFFNQIYGTKTFILFGPEQTPFVYPDEDNGLTSQIEQIENVDLARFPLFASAQPIRIQLQPGETLYLPHGWWHTTHMHSTSITVIVATWHRVNWVRFCQQYRIRGKTSGWKKAAVLGYLYAVGAVLGVRDHVFPSSTAERA